MDCCSLDSQRNYKMKGGGIKMNTRVMLWIIIGAMFVLALFLTFKAGATSSLGAASDVASTASRSAASASSSYGGMVGGC